MSRDRVSLRHHAFVAPVRWLRAADVALAQYAASDDAAILTDVVRRWDEEIDRERVAARIEPSAQAWAEVEGALARAGMAPIGARRAVFRDPWETLARSLRRLARLEELRGPEIVIQNERELAPRLWEALDQQREAGGVTRGWDRIPSEDGGEIVDLSQFGWEIAQRAAGAFPRSVGLGDQIERALAARTRERLQELAALDGFWEIHRQPFWEGGHHASSIVADPEIWSPESIRGARALELPASASSRSCAAWRALMPSVPVGDRGGPLFVRTEAGAGDDWWPRQLAPEACVVSFVLVETPESQPFLVSDEG